MIKERIPDDRKMTGPQRSEDAERAVSQPTETVAKPTGLTGLHRHIGNQAVQRLLAQRSGRGAYELSEKTSDRINRERGGGQPLEASVQTQMGQSMGHDFSAVQVHTSQEASALSQQLDAKAFTTGQDIFFREGAYEPHSTTGRELIAHELTHVVQQGAGVGSGGGRMTVNAPSDTYEQEADATASAVAQTTTPLQRQEVPEEELATAAVQTQEEEEELAQPQIEEEEEELQA
jgi:hypothetical protein